MKHVQKIMLVPEHLSLETRHQLTSPPQFATLTRLDQDMKQIMDFSLPEDQTTSLLDQLLHRYQGLSRQMNTEATAKSTVTTTPSPAPTGTSSTHPPKSSLGKPKKVMSRKLPAKPKSTAATVLSTSKILSPVVRSASQQNERLPQKRCLFKKHYNQHLPVNLEFIFLLQRSMNLFHPRRPCFQRRLYFFWKLLCPHRLVRKPRTTMVERLRSNRQWERY